MEIQTEICWVRFLKVEKRLLEKFAAKVSIKMLAQKFEKVIAKSCRKCYEIGLWKIESEKQTER